MIISNGLAERWVQSVSQTILKILNGYFNEWNKNIDAIQYFLNIKITQYTGSKPFALMLARTENQFNNYTNTESIQLDEENVRRRLEYMTNLVYPAINKKVLDDNIKRANEFTNSRRIKKYDIGSWVMVLDDLRSSKTDARYTGPCQVKKLNHGGAYIIQDESGVLYTRPPSSLKP